MTRRRGHPKTSQHAFNFKSADPCGRLKVESDEFLRVQISVTALRQLVLNGQLTVRDLRGEDSLARSRLRRLFADTCALTLHVAAEDVLPRKANTRPAAGANSSNSATQPSRQPS